MIVNYQKPIIFTNVCGCIFEPSLLYKAILWYTKKPLASNKKIFLYGRYPAISIHGQKIHVHRLVYQYIKGQLLPSNIHIHHKDGNRLNALIYNLTSINAPEHLSGHNTGKTLTKKHRIKIALANHKRKGSKMKKKVYIPLDELKSMLSEGRSILSISRRFGCDWSTIRARIHDNPELLTISQEGQE